MRHEKRVKIGLSKQAVFTLFDPRNVTSFYTRSASVKYYLHFPFSRGKITADLICGIAVSEKTLYLQHRITTSRINPADIAVYLPFVWGGRIERLPACGNVDTLSKRHFYRITTMIKNLTIPDLIPAEQYVGSSKMFLKRYHGENMSPELKPGDLLICRKLQAVNFGLWGEIYLLATDQGLLIGRIDPGKNGYIVVRPINPEFSPYEVPLTSIYEVALVTGRITEYTY